METPAQPQASPAVILRRARVVELKPQGAKTACTLSEGSPLLVSNFLAHFIQPGDEIAFPLAIGSPSIGTEILARKASAAKDARDIYLASIGYAAQPKPDQRGQLFVHAEVEHGQLGIGAIHLPCAALRDYFYVANRRRAWGEPPNLYEVLRMPSTVSPAELRLGFRLRELELQAAGAPQAELTAIERAFNILGQPELRACYDALRVDSSAAVLFPYAGFGSLIATGDRSRDGQTFFARRILAFLPERHSRRFHAPLRRFDFMNKTALYRDPRRKLEVLLDPAALPLVWDQTWNPWKHRLAAKVEIQGDFVETGKCRLRRGEWQRIKWEVALPSRIQVKLPANLLDQIEAARQA